MRIKRRFDMNDQGFHGHRLSRRTALRLGTGTAVVAAATSLLPRAARAAPRSAPAGGQPAAAQDDDALFRELDAKVEAGMARYRIPGVAVGVYYRGREYVRGYGVTNVDHPQPVDGDTLFRIGSTTKTFTGTTVMRLVEQGLLDLAAPVRTYLPNLKLADESVAASVRVRQLLNHSAGWLGDFQRDFGRGDDAIARYVAGMTQLPQLTPPGGVFAYNNAAIVLAGYLSERVAGHPYEDVVRRQVLDPLGLDHTFFFSDEIVGYDVAASHRIEGEQPVVASSLWPLPRSLNPTGGLISSARDQLRYARFHLGDGRAADGTPVLSPATLQAMRTDLGPGGTLGVELDGVGVTWWQHRTAEGVPVFQHGGDWPGQHSGFFFVPDRGFALTVLTNCTSGPALIGDLFFDNWALRQFAGLSNPPAVAQALSPAQLAPYEGLYWAREVDPAPGEPAETWIEFSAADGRLRARLGDEASALTQEYTLAFYRDNYVVRLDGQGQPTFRRADFIPGPDGRIAWYRSGGRLHALQAEVRHE
jgi:CubicO group peptidase (beta-lactamase class C family)